MMRSPISLGILLAWKCGTTLRMTLCCMCNATAGSFHGLEDEALKCDFIGISHANPTNLSDCL